MYKATCPIRLKHKQRLLLVPLGDIHFDTEECDRERLLRFMQWVEEQEQQGALVRIIGMGDYLDCQSPSERQKTVGAGFHRTTVQTMDKLVLANLQEFVSAVRPLSHRMLGLLSGHHYWRFGTHSAGEWAGKSSDEWLAHALHTPYCGDGVALLRLVFPPTKCFLDVLALHGGGSGQTPGGRVMKRIQFSEIAPTAHVVISGHDNAKLAYPRSGLDFDHGMIKRYVIGSGSFQRAYLEGQEASYAEQMGLAPADLGVTVLTVTTEKRNERWRVDYHASV